MNIDRHTNLIIALINGKAEEQASLLEAAFEMILGPVRTSKGGFTRWHDKWFAFEKMLRAGAFESAAIMLIPADAGYELMVGLPDGPKGFVSHQFKIDWDDRNCLPAAMPALALAAAAVQAHAVRTIDAEPSEVLEAIAAAIEQDAALVRHSANS